MAKPCCAWTAGTKRNADEQSTHRTQGRARVTQALDRVRQAARQRQKERFTSLLHHLSIELFGEAFLSLKRDAAPGVDNLTWRTYAANLERNLADLHARVHRGAYRALPSRRTYIPKADGRQRPLAVASLEDKIVQKAAAAVLNSIYEEEFLGFNYGFRPKRSQHDCLDALVVGISSKRVNFNASIDPERIAAIIVEPVQGEGGFNVAPFEFLRKLRELADRYGIVLIADEIQAGMARTGKLYAFEHVGVAADLVTMAKGLAGGFPLAAVTGREEVVDAAPLGGIGGTHAGNPLAVAAAHAVLDVIEDEQLCARAEEIGNRIRTGLVALSRQQGMEPIGDVRGLGAMMAFELVTNRGTRSPDPALAQAIVAEAEARGLILLACGVYGNVIRLLPPLTTPIEIIDRALEIIEASVEAAIHKAHT